MRKRIQLVGLSLSIASFVFAADPATKPVATPDHTDALRGPALIVDGANRDALSISNRDIHVVIQGFRAQTTMSLTLRNDANRVLEGELVFPLPDGATVSGYGLDVNGQMVDGVAVEKQSARISYEKEVHKGIDPGLLEHVAGNNFRTRVYPIPASGTRMVKVQYVSTLGSAEKGLRYTLPLDWAAAKGECNLKIEVIGAGEAPVDRSSQPTRLEFTRQGDRYLASRTIQNQQMNGDLSIAVPAPTDPVAVERIRNTYRVFENFNEEAQEPASDFNYYFAIDTTPEIPAIKRAEVAPRRIGVLWDASMSRENAHKKREIGLLRALLSGIGQVDLDLFVFRNCLEKPVTISIHNCDTLPLTAALDAIVYDGGTRLDDLSFPKNRSAFSPDAAPVPDYDYWLLFTDGISDLGAPFPGTAQVPVYPICNDDRANHALLRYIADQSGGEYFNLETLADERVLASIGHEAFSLLSIDFNDHEIAQVYPRGRQPIQGHLTLSGKLLAPAASITLHYGLGSTEFSKQTYTLHQNGATQTGLVPLLWANQKVADLSVFPDENRAKLLQIGREFNLATPATSLLVLETAEQYAMNQVVPPANRPDVYAAFLGLVNERRASAKKSQEERLNTVVAMWNERVKWWEEKHEYPKDLKVVADASPQSVAPTTQPAGETLILADRLAQRGEEASAASERRQSAELAPTPAATAQPVVVGGISGVAGPQNTHLAAMDRQFSRLTNRLSSVSVSTEPPVAGNAAISIKEWDPNTPYLQAMKAAPPKAAYNVYLEQRKTFGSGPAFFLDCADYFLRENQRDLGLRVLTDVAELRIEDPALLRIVAYRLSQLGEHDLAIGLFEQIREMRPEEPQSHRDLALALAERADQSLAVSQPQRSWRGDAAARAMSDYRRSLDLLNQVIIGQWDRFEGIQVVALMEANRIFERARELSPDLASPLDPRLTKLLDLGLRVVLTWDTDATDVDLWVTEPSGEKCYYQHNLTTIGGLLSRDMTDGYGPEEYCLRKLMPGKYLIQANFFGSRNQSLVGPTTVHATVITHFGQPDEKRQSLTLRLTDNKEVVDVGSVTLK